MRELSHVVNSKEVAITRSELLAKEYKPYRLPIHQFIIVAETTQIIPSRTEIENSLDAKS